MRLAAKTPRVLILVGLAQVWGVRSVSACAVCFADDDSGLSAGLNAGIAVLLGLALLVQLIVGRFLWKVVKRSRLERDDALGAQQIVQISKKPEAVL